MSDVPLGAMLSGGLDSSLIVALMARHMTEPVETFAVGFAGEDSELPDARRVADALGANHHELEVALQSDPEYLSRLIWHLDEPLADLSSIGFLALCELAAEHVTVALSGQGADELFGGYRKHRVASLAEQLGARARRAARAGAAAVLRRGPGRAGRLADALQAGDPVARLLRLQRLRPPRPARRAVRRRARRARRRRRARRARHAGRRARAPRRSRPRSTWTRGSASSTTCSPTSTARRWRARSRSACRSSTTSSSSCARRSRPSHKVRRLQGKHVLRDAAARPACPDFVLDKKKKGFFNEKVGAWLGAAGGALVDRVLLGARPRLRAGRRSGARSRRAVAECRAGRRRQREAAARARDARAVARRVPAARDGAGPRAGGRLTRCATRSSRRRATRRPTSRGSRAAIDRPDAAAGRLGGRRRRLDRRRRRRARGRSRASTPGSGRSSAPAPTARSRWPTAAARRATSTASCSAPCRCATSVDVIVKVDADIDFEPDYFERLIGALRGRRRARHRERHVLRAGGRRVGAAHQGRPRPSGAPAAPTGATAWPT